MNSKSNSAGYLLGVFSMWSTPQKKEKAGKKMTEWERDKDLLSSALPRLVPPAYLFSPPICSPDYYWHTRCECFCLIPPASALTHTHTHSVWSLKPTTAPPPHLSPQWMALLPRGLPGLQHCQVPCLQIWVCAAQNEVRLVITRRLEDQSWEWWGGGS